MNGSPERPRLSVVRATLDDVEHPLEPFWRGVIAFRLLTLVTVIGVTLWHLDGYARPYGAAVVLVVMTLWTAVLSWGYLGRLPGLPDRRGALAVADLAVCCLVMAATPLVVFEAQLDAGTPGMGSIWTSGSVLACAVAFRIRGGLIAALVISAALVLSKWRFGLLELGDIELLVLAGLTVGFASRVLQRAAARLRRSAAQQAADAERERLTRQIHDGVLQVLAHVQRRGTEMGGGAAELGTLAGEQEVALRTLLTAGAPTTDATGHRDLGAALRTLSSPRVTVSAPADPLELPASVTDEIEAVVRAALANVDAHAGPEARAWVLVEELDRDLEISVRDDGPGIPDGRLAEAESEGRLGVARSIRGRVEQLGGTLSLDTGPGRGTEWAVRVPRPVRTQGVAS
ncbi:signal transduction histidine kinase [Pseudonocardia endophytica]|uniref:Signal transduction histidine kinase n=1 Tax=Pseudonocardia endophytica TaxID=401976 RepID=A0A4R1HIK9_PSEEN|nr:signal transduction histidine kinase [Pseudonocardia endophytica]